MQNHNAAITIDQQRWPRLTGQVGGRNKVESLHGNAASKAQSMAGDPRCESILFKVAVYDMIDSNP